MKPAYFPLWSALAGELFGHRQKQRVVERSAAACTDLPDLIRKLLGIVGEILNHLDMFHQSVEREMVTRLHRAPDRLNLFQHYIFDALLHEQS